MTDLHNDRFPNETPEYRAARNELLLAEVELRRKVEEVTAKRRALPLGGAAKEDYLFENTSADPVRLSQLFAPGKDSLVTYGFMYGPGGSPCPMCTAFLDSLNGNAPHLEQRINLAVIAKAPSSDLAEFAGSRGWSNLRLLSSGGNTFNTDYITECGEAQIPVLNVFRKTSDGIFHSYATELFFAPAEEGQHNRHVGMMWPLWNIFDLTPDGRGENWFPGLNYD